MLSDKQMRTINLMSKDTWMFASELANELGTATGKIWPTLASLVDKGLVETKRYNPNRNTLQYKLRKDCGVLHVMEPPKKEAYVKRDSFNSAGDGMLRILVKTTTGDVRKKARKELKRRGLE